MVIADLFQTLLRPKTWKDFTLACPPEQMLTGAIPFAFSFVSSASPVQSPLQMAASRSSLTHEYDGLYTLFHSGI